jgi:hypothetical protein
MSQRVPAEVRHSWILRKGTLHTYDCAWCKSWTANLPLYEAEVCPKRDRRVGKLTRRKND